MQQWKRNIRFWEVSPFFRLLLLFISGIFCYDRLDPFRLSLPPLLILVVIIAVIYSLPKAHHLLKGIMMHTALLLTGYIAAFTDDIRNDRRWFGNNMLQGETYAVRILETPEEKERTRKLQVKVEKVISNGSVKEVKGDAFIYIYKGDSLADYHTGDLILVSSKWQPLKNPGNPHEFDYATFCKRNNIYYQQFLSENDIIKVSDGNIYSLSPAKRVHRWAMQQLERYVKDQSTLGLLQAMLLGNEINFSDEDRQLYVDTGIIHIVAISGGHIVFLMTLITYALFWIKKRHYWIKPAVAIPVVAFYVMVAGAPPSAVRAAVVFSLLAISMFLKRDNSSLNTLFAAAFAILFVKPMWLFSVGFQLSFVAVLSLILFYKRIYVLYTLSNRGIRFIWKTIAASLAAELLVAPLVIYYFHFLPAAFLLANVIAALFMSLIILLGLAIILFHWLPFFAECFSTATIYLVKGFQSVMGSVRLLNPESFKYLHFTTVELLLSYLVIGAAATYILQRSKIALHISLAGLCFLLLSFNLKQWRAVHQEQIVIYNVPKHAYAEYISGKGYTVLSESGDSISPKKIDYAVKENHVKQKAWRQMAYTRQELIRFKDQKLLFLKSPVKNDTQKFQNIDYVILEYPVSDFNAADLLNIFDFKTLIITGNQRRKTVQQWKDSCRKHCINAHFTMLDGAYVINP